MAQADRKTETRKVTKTVEVEETVETITLTLSKAESETLMFIVGEIGGEPKKSRRKHTDAVYHALLKANVTDAYDLKYNSDSDKSFAWQGVGAHSGRYFVTVETPIAD